MNVAYRIPSDSVLSVAIAEALRRHDVVSSQSKLAKITRERLYEMDPNYKVTVERVRRVAIQTGIATVEIKTREDSSKESSSECPACGSRMRKVKNKTLYGKAVTLGYKCGKCKYSTGKLKSVPVRYSFKYALSKEKFEDIKNADILRF